MATRKAAKKASPRGGSARKSAGAARKSVKKASTPARKRKVAPIPKGFHTATPYLVIAGAVEAIAFYAQAFGAKEKVRMHMPDGSIMHAEIQIGDSRLMLTDEHPEWGAKSPTSLGGNATHVMLYVKDCDAVMARAIDAGASVVKPVSTEFWGDRYGQVVDPFGHKWSIATHIEDVPARQMQKRADAAMQRAAQMQEDPS